MNTSKFLVAHLQLLFISAITQALKRQITWRGRISLSEVKRFLGREHSDIKDCNLYLGKEAPCPMCLWAETVRMYSAICPLSSPGCHRCHRHPCQSLRCLLRGNLPCHSVYGNINDSFRGHSVCTEFLFLRKKEWDHSWIHKSWVCVKVSFVSK